MKEKILKFYYLNMISFKCSPLLFKQKRILRTVFSMTFSKISRVILLISSIMLFFNSWRVGGHRTSPKREIKRPEKAALYSIAMVSPDVCGVAPSCWNHKFCISKSSSCGNKYCCIICL